MQTTEEPVTFVQEPDEIPGWVEELEAAYIFAVDNFLRAHEAYNQLEERLEKYHVTALPCNTNFEEINSFIESIISAIVRRCQTEFAPTGTKLKIPRDLPKALDIGLVYSHANPKSWVGNPKDFSPAKVYQYLEHKYHRAGVVGKVAEQAAEELIDIVGRGALYYTGSPQKNPDFHNPNGSLKNLISRFDALHTHTKKAVIYKLKMYEGYSTNAGIIWNTSSAGDGIRLLNALRSVHALIFLGTDVDNRFKNFTGTVEHCLERIRASSGGLYELGYTDDFPGSYRYVFRKTSLELHLPHELHEKILLFLSKHFDQTKVRH